MSSKILLLFILVALSKGIFSCEVVSPERIYKDSLAKDYDFRKVLTFNNCSSDQMQKTLSFFSDFQGDLHPRLLEQEAAVQLSNPVRIISLNQAITSLGQFEPGQFFRETAILQGQHVLTGSQTSSLQVECNQCSGLGEKTLAIKLYDSLSGQYSSAWVRGKLQVKSNALKATKVLNLRSKSLSPRDFKEEEVFTSHPQRFFQDVSQIAFYKLTRNKNKGEALLQSDLTPLYLVRVGNPVSVNLNHKGVKLEAQAIASQSGHLGQTIRLKNAKTKKTIIGKVVDFNQVEVEL